NAGGAYFSNMSSFVSVAGAFSNAGTLVFMNSVGTFNGAVVNSGAWISDPSTNVFFADHTVTASGYISASAGDVYIFKSNFVNVSTNNLNYDTLNAKFIFHGTNTATSSTYTQAFYVAGLNLGSYGSSVLPTNETFFNIGPDTFSTNAFSTLQGNPLFG